MTVAEQLKKESREETLEEAAANLLEAHAPTDLIIKATGFIKAKIIALAKRLSISLKPQVQ